MFPEQTIFSTIPRKLAHFYAKPRFVKIWFLPTWILLGLSKLLIVLFTFKRLYPLLGKHHGTAAMIPLLDDEREIRAELICQCIATASRYTPWNSNCFPQAIAARLLLGIFDIPYAVCFGLARDKHHHNLVAHAWVSAGRVQVSGGEGFDTYTVVGCFLDPQLQGINNT